jgi:hypothetical protein
MKKIPVIFKEKWQLYQAENGEIIGFHIDLLEIINDKDYMPDAVMFHDGMLGGWRNGSRLAFIAPGRFSADDFEKIIHMSKLDWRHQQVHDDPAENLSLFDQERAPTEEETEKNGGGEDEGKADEAAEGTPDGDEDRE